jgi:Uma2 family endonuclease
MATVMTDTPVKVPIEQRFRISGIDWPTYVKFSDLFPERRIRITYDRGEMELMTVSPEHERGKHLLGRLIDVLTEELEIDMAGYGSMTCRREDIERGFEPDECYWIKHEQAMRGRDKIDFRRDPPPDLAVEVEISRSSIARLPLYASLGVPEIWLWDGERLRVGLLGSDGQYHDSDRSQSFPFLPLTEVVRFLAMGGVSETRVVRAFREWVREQQARGWAQPEKARPKRGKGRPKKQ